MHGLVNKPYSETKDLLKQYIILPKAVNGLHIYAYMNRAKDFESAVEDGLNYLKSYEGTPLDIALEKKSYEVIEKILNYIS